MNNAKCIFSDMQQGMLQVRHKRGKRDWVTKAQGGRALIILYFSDRKIADYINSRVPRCELVYLLFLKSPDEEHSCGPAVNPCTQGPEFVRRHPWLYLRLAAAKTFRNRDVLTPEISFISNRHDKKHVGLAYIWSSLFWLLWNKRNRQSRILSTSFVAIGCLNTIITDQINTLTRRLGVKFTGSYIY